MIRRSTRLPVRRGREVTAPARRRAGVRHGLTTLVAAGMLGALVVPGATPAAAAPSIPAVTGQAPAAELDPTLVAKLEAALDEGFASSGVPGVIVGAWIPGYGEWVSQRGVADLATDAPMARGNQQAIGSITKTFIGIVALQVIEDGRYDLSLDSTIDRWYPEIPEASKITVRMLLNMSSGVGNSPQGQVDRICADPYATPTPDEVIAANMAYPRAPFAPGEGFDYANANFYIAGRILEQVTGTDLETLVREGTTDPLGLTRTRLGVDGQLAAPLARGYTWFCPDLPPATDTTDWPANESWAAGAMLSTLDELHTYGDALGSGALLSPAGRAAQVDEATPRETPGLSYGLGVQVFRDVATGCVTVLQHAGAELGYQSDLYAFPTTGATIVVLGNGNGYDSRFTAIMPSIIPLLVGLAVETPTEPCGAPVAPTTTEPPAPAPAPVATAPVATVPVAATATPRFTG